MKSYAPANAQSPKEWKSLSQSGHLARIENYHREQCITCDNPQSHAVLHLAVENQLISSSGKVVRETLSRLMNSGLGRHEAIHVIGELYMDFELSRPKPHPDAIDWEGYETELKALYQTE